MGSRSSGRIGERVEPVRAQHGTDEARRSIAARGKRGQRHRRAQDVRPAAAGCPPGIPPAPGNAAPGEISGVLPSDAVVGPASPAFRPVVGEYAAGKDLGDAPSFDAPRRARRRGGRDRLRGRSGGRASHDPRRRRDDDPPRAGRRHAHQRRPLPGSDQARGAGPIAPDRRDPDEIRPPRGAAAGGLPACCARSSTPVRRAPGHRSLCRPPAVQRDGRATTWPPRSRASSARPPRTRPAGPSAAGSACTCRPPTPASCSPTPRSAGLRTAMGRAGGGSLAEDLGRRGRLDARPVARVAVGDPRASSPPRGVSPTRVHVMLSGGDQATPSGRRARTGSAGTPSATAQAATASTARYRLSVATFYRLSFPHPATDKSPAVGCVGAPAPPPPRPGAAGLVAAAGHEAAGLAVPPGGLVTPPLVAGEPAQVTLQLGAATRSGLAAAPRRVVMEALWHRPRGRRPGPGRGVVLDAPIGGDGAGPAGVHAHRAGARDDAAGAEGLSAC